MAPPVDPNQVLMTGENSFIRLSPDGGKTQSGRVSHWRVLWCPAGAGHTLFLQSELTKGKVRIYTDNEAVTRWLQKTIESLLYPAFADASLAVELGDFSRSGGVGTGASAHAGASEHMLTRDTEIVLWNSKRLHGSRLTRIQERRHRRYGQGWKVHGPIVPGKSLTVSSVQLRPPSELDRSR